MTSPFSIRLKESHESLTGRENLCLAYFMATWVVATSGLIAYIAVGLANRVLSASFLQITDQVMILGCICTTSGLLLRIAFVDAGIRLNKIKQTETK